VLILRKIAITGSLAAGKSTVCRILEEYGAYVVDADEIVHGLLSPNTPTGKRVIELLGSGIVVANQINKKKISEIVFSDPNKLKALEKILHPAVKQEIEKRYAAIKNNPSYKYFVAEIPLLFEAGMENDFDTVITVTADTEIARSRFGKDHFDERSTRQLTPAIKASKSHFTITNNGDLNTLKSSIRKIVDTF
jgi:dephospho-CoA kinase